MAKYNKPIFPRPFVIAMITLAVLGLLLLVGAGLIGHFTGDK